jgi:hypothetical protein
MLDISWKYTVPEENGAFAVLYQCRDGFQLRMPLATSTTAIPCGSPYMIGNKETKATRLLPMLAGPSAIDVPISVMFMTAGTSTPTKVAQGNTTVTISPRSSTAATSTPVAQPQTQTPEPRPTTPVSTPTPTPTPAPKPTGPADLVVRIISVGVIDPISGNILPRGPISPAETVAVTFDIKNQGGMATGAWHFTANLPTNPMTPYVSPQQKSLNPGDGIQNTLRFNQSTGGTFSVSVDPSNFVRESNESNNNASQWIQLQGGYPYGY